MQTTGLEQVQQWAWAPQGDSTELAPVRALDGNLQAPRACNIISPALHEDQVTNQVQSGNLELQSVLTRR